MPRPLPPSAAQYGLVLALFAVLLLGLLVPDGYAQAVALSTSEAGTPVASGTPRPAPPASPASGAPAQVTPTAPGRAPPVSTPTDTPTAPPSGGVSAVVSSALTPLAFTLKGREQIAETTLVVAVSDTAPATRQPGWTLSLSVDQFRVAGNAERTLPPDAITLLGVTAACADADCTIPTNTVAYPFVMPAGATVPIFAAAPGSGGGQFTITPIFVVTVPANAYAGSYTTAIAVEVAR